ncbi:hypothetical protein ACVWYH_000114 [Bradyrhizobium sp. GM24.11]
MPHQGVYVLDGSTTRFGGDAEALSQQVLLRVRLWRTQPAPMQVSHGGRLCEYGRYPR